MLHVRFVLDIHRDQIATYGGAPGVRDLAGLESALGQVDLEVFGERLHPTPPLRAAALLFHLARSHPFVDGNKRTAWAAMTVQLLLEGWTLVMPQDHAYRLVNEAAAGKWAKDALANELAAHLRPSV